MNYIEVAKIDEIPEGKSKLVQVGDSMIALHHVGSNYYATEELCPHRAGPLSEGKLNGKILTCPWHHAHFDVTTGKVIGDGPAKRNLVSYQVKIEKDRILVLKGN